MPFKQSIQKFYSYFYCADCSVKPIQYKALTIGILLLLLASIRVYYNLYDYMDIVYGDEAVYMKIGLNLSHSFNRDWGPMYCLWYKLLSFIFSDTIQLYYFNYAITAIVAVILIYAAFIFLNIHPIVAFYFALCFLASKASVPLWPRVSFFTISILLTGMIILSRLREVYLRLLVFSTFLLIACYARPEFYLSFIISVLVFLVYFFATALYKRKDIWRTIFLFAATIFLLHIIFLFPSNQYQGYPRSLAAFYQHYLINRFFAGTASEYDWIYWKDVHQFYFKNCHSIFDVIWNYPGEFFWHISTNVKNYLIEIVLKNLSVIFPYLMGMNKLYFGGAVVVFLFSIFCLTLKPIREEFVLLLKKNFFYLFILFIWGLPTIISSILIFPRNHYILLNYFLFIIPLCLLFTCFIKRYVPKKFYTYLFLLTILFIPFLSSCKYHAFFLTDTKDYTMCSRKALEHIKNKTLDNKIKYTFFSDIHCFIGFLPNNFGEINTIFDKTANVPFSYILDHHKPDFILVNNCMEATPSMSNDATWKRFIAHPKLYGYRYEVVEGCPYYFLVLNTIHDKK